MTIINKEYLVIKRKNKLVGYKNVQLIVENAMKTRIRKDNNLVFVNAPSREIKKWFELRKI